MIRRILLRRSGMDRLSDSSFLRFEVDFESSTTGRAVVISKRRENFFYFYRFECRVKVNFKIRFRLLYWRDVRSPRSCQIA